MFLDCGFMANTSLTAIGRVPKVGHLPMWLFEVLDCRFEGTGLLIVFLGRSTCVGLRLRINESLAATIWHFATRRIDCTACHRIRGLTVSQQTAMFRCHACGGRAEGLEAPREAIASTKRPSPARSSPPRAMARKRSIYQCECPGSAATSEWS